MRAVFFYTGVDWSGSARAFSVAARAFAEAGDPVTFVVDPEAHVQEHVPGASFEIAELDASGGWLNAALGLRKIVRRKNPDVVFVHTDREQLIAAVACWLARRAGIVRRTPAGTRLNLGTGARFATRLRRTVFLFTHEADVRAAVLPRGATTVVAELGVEPSRYTVDPTTDELAQADEATPDRDKGSHFLCIYDLHARGRAAMAIRTLAMLAQRHPAVHLFVVGPGSDYEDVRMHIAAVNLLPRVSLLGERDDVAALIGAADLGWVACEGDEAAFAMLDMMALGVPVVTAEDAIARRYVADGITGLVVPWGDAALAAGMVAGLLANPERIEAMGEAARARVARDFGERSMVQGFDSAATQARARK
jgi:glycosyltransferase involved in cell wall biosynthesis